MFLFASVAASSTADVLTRARQYEDFWFSFWCAVMVTWQHRNAPLIIQVVRDSRLIMNIDLKQGKGVMKAVRSGESYKWETHFIMSSIPQLRLYDQEFDDQSNEILNSYSLK